MNEDILRKQNSTAGHKDHGRGRFVSVLVLCSSSTTAGERGGFLEVGRRRRRD